MKPFDMWCLRTFCVEFLIPEAASHCKINSVLIKGLGLSSLQQKHLPACFMSPMRMMCGQCCRVFAKKGLVTPRMTEGLQRETDQT